MEQEPVVSVLDLEMVPVSRDRLMLHPREGNHRDSQLLARERVGAEVPAQEVSIELCLANEIPALLLISARVALELVGFLILAQKIKLDRRPLGSPVPH